MTRAALICSPAFLVAALCCVLCAQVPDGQSMHDIFATLLCPPTKASIGSRADQLKADHGHIVVRVAPGGDSYRVYVLDDTTETRTLRGVFGPYATR